MQNFDEIQREMVALLEEAGNAMFDRYVRVACEINEVMKKNEVKESEVFWISFMLEIVRKT